MCYLEQALRPVPWLLSVPFPETLGVTHASVDLPVGLFLKIDYRATLPFLHIFPSAGMPLFFEIALKPRYNSHNCISFCMNVIVPFIRVKSHV